MLHWGGINLIAPALGAGETGSWYVSNAGFSGSLSTNTGNTTTFDPSPTKYECTSGDYFVSYVVYTLTNSSGCSSSKTFTINYRYGENTFYAEAIPTTACGLCTDLYGACSLDGSGQWSYSGPGTASFGDITASQTRVCVDQEGEYTFTWTVNGGCRPGSDSDIVTFKNFGSGTLEPDAGPDQTFCGFPASFSLAATPLELGQTGVWTQINGAPASITDNTDPTTSVTAIISGGGPYVFAWEVFGETCSKYDTVRMEEVPSLPANIIETEPCRMGCSGNMEVIQMDQISTSDTFFFSVQPTVMPELQVQDIGGIVLTYTITEYDVNGNFVGIISSGTSPVLAAGDVWTANSSQWGVDWSNSDRFSIGIEARRTSGLRDYYRGNYEFSIIYGNECEVKNEYIETIDVCNTFTGTTPNAGTDAVLACGTTSVQLSGNNIMSYGGILFLGYWQTLDGPTDPFVTGSVDRHQQQPTLTGLLDGTYTFRYQTYDPLLCAMEYDDVVITVSTAAPVLTAAIAETEACGSGEVTLVAELAGGATTGTWTQTAGPAATIGDANAEVTTVTGLSANTSYTFQWSATNICGTSSTTVSFTTSSNAPPDVADISTNGSCLSSTASSQTIEAASVSGGSSGIWSIISEPVGSVASIASPTSASTTIDGMSVYGVYKVEWAVTNSPCPNVSRDTLVIFIGETNTFPNDPTPTGDDLSFCGVTLPLTTAMAAPADEYPDALWEWSLVSGPQGVDIADKLDPYTDVTYYAEGTYVFQLYVHRVNSSIFSSFCSSVYDMEPATIEVVISSASTPPAVAGPDQESCGGSSFTLDAEDLGVGESGAWSVVSTTGASVSFADNTDPNTTATLSEAGQVTLRWSTFGGSSACIPNADELVLTWIEQPDAGEDHMLCNSSSIALNGTEYDFTGATVSWTHQAGPGSRQF